jgi:6-phosphogluconolactonase (cycloisomerase 2 family)
MKNIPIKAFAFAIACLSVLAPTAAFAQYGGASHYAYVETNDASLNQILVYKEGPGGALREVDAVATGGAGNGGSLGQGALTLAGNGHILFAVNNGSNTISVFRITPQGLTLLQVVASGGYGPLSISENEGLVYVLNAGGTLNNITGFVWTREAGLIPIPSSTKQLSAASPTPVQIGITPDANQVVVTEKATNLIDVFNLTWEGRPSSAVVNKSAAATPFGFAFDSLGDLLVSDANGGLTGGAEGSSYAINPSGTLAARTAVAPAHQTSACWATTDIEGRFLYLADAGSNAITAFRINYLGGLSLINPNGLAAATSPHPVDMAPSKDNQYLYALSNVGGAIDEFVIGADGSLTPIGTVYGLPTTSSGLVTN